MGINGWIKHTPLWNNKNLQELKEIGTIKTWEKSGIVKLVQLYNQALLKSFATLKVEFGIPENSLYNYIQIKHALKSQFGDHGPSWSESAVLQKLGDREGHGGTIAEIYPHICKNSIETPEKRKSRGKWERELGAISDGQWREILVGGHRVSISPAQRISHLMVIHRTYYTPKRLFEFGRGTDANCP